MPSAASSSRTFSRPQDIPPLREDPFEPDGHDDERVAWIKSLWHSQDDLLRGRDRQVEENVRMLCGQHWIVWSDLRQRFIDVAEMLEDDEKRWRHMPVLNRLFLWFMLIHARMTENPPVLTWQPGPDRIDAMLAEVADPIYKHVWSDTDMIEVLGRLFSWLIPSGTAYLKSRIDPTKGPAIEAKGPAILELLDASGDPVMGPSGEPIRRMADEVPFDEHGDPRARLFEAEGGDVAFEPTGDPHVFHEGGIEVDVLTCLQVRGEWGPAPWHKKAWHCHRSLLTPLQAWETFGVELEPDVRGEQSEDLGIIWRLLHGSGLFGAADGDRHQQTDATQSEFVTIYEAWFPPGRTPGTQMSPTNPGGRLVIVTGNGEVLRDGPRTAKFKHVSPIREFGFVNLPGRPHASTPQEMLNGPVRTRNRLHAQILQHATLLSNPRQVANRDAGLDEGDLTNRPGETIWASRDRIGDAPVVEYVQAPNLGRDVYDAADRLKDEVDELGQVRGTEGAPPTEDASGELVKELRFNADRFIGSTMKAAVIELGRLAEDWMAMLPTIWDEEKVISVAGEDGIARTITVFPRLFEQGNVDVEPEIESMLPESRGERQQRVLRMYERGMFGEPGTPEAINAYFDLARFPHMSRAVRPGGIDRTTAEQNVGKLLQGTPATEIPIFEWYDHGVHLHVLERFMKSPEYLKLDVQVQHQFVVYRRLLQQAQFVTQLQQARQDMALQGEVARGQVEQAADLQEQAETRGVGGEPPERGATADTPRGRDAVVA